MLTLEQISELRAHYPIQHLSLFYGKFGKKNSFNSHSPIKKFYVILGQYISTQITGVSSSGLKRLVGGVKLAVYLALLVTRSSSIYHLKVVPI